MGGYPRSCEEVIQDLQERHRPFLDKDWNPAPIGEDAVLYRLVREQDIDPNTKKPFRSTFSSPGLSVLVHSINYPLDLRRYIEESEIFVGAVQLNIEQLKEMGYQICLDPHPDPFGNKQHPNHAQVVCKKTQGKTNQIRDNCEWSFCPDSCL